MAETRSKTQNKDQTLRDLEQNWGSRIEALEKNMEDIKETLKTMSQSMAKGFAARNEEVNQAKQPPLLATPSGNHSENQMNRTGNSFNYSGLTRLSKLDFPKFNGEGLKSWLFKAEQFFALDHTPEELKVSISSIHFEGVASVWHQSISENETSYTILNGWSQYKQLLMERFGEILDDPMAELKQLQETDGIIEYHERFELLKTRINLPEEYVVSAYLAGLRMDTQMHVRMFQPQSIRQCLLLGRLYEKAHPRKFATMNWPKPVKDATPWTKNEDLNLQKRNVSEFKPTARTRLTNEEMEKRRAQGLCYFCDEKFTPEHYGKHRNTQLYYMTAAEEMDSEIGERDEAMLISKEEDNRHHMNKYPAFKP